MGSECSRHSNQTELRDERFCSKRRQVLDATLAQAPRPPSFVNLSNDYRCCCGAVGPGGLRFAEPPNRGSTTGPPRDHRPGITGNRRSERPGNLGQVSSLYPAVEPHRGLPSRDQPKSTLFPQSCPKASTSKVNTHVRARSEPHTRGGRRAGSKISVANASGSRSKRSKLTSYVDDNENVQGVHEFRKKLIFLSLEEEKERLQISNERLTGFCNMEDIFVRSMKGTPHCSAELKLFSLQGRRREFIREQEHNEWRQLLFSVNQTLLNSSLDSKAKGFAYSHLDENSLYWPSPTSERGCIRRPFTAAELNQLARSNSETDFYVSSDGLKKPTSHATKMCALCEVALKNVLSEDIIDIDRINRKIARQIYLLNEISSYCSPTDSGSSACSKERVAGMCPLTTNDNLQSVACRPLRLPPRASTTTCTSYPVGHSCCGSVSSTSKGLPDYLRKECNFATRKRLVSLLQE
ncbi:hypothetical protein, conserved [Trypanosoma brucei gambiense DAL972]|uniref:Uncharacterized protein n=1 Tax=Trypanosoma brucei gambiense (strain MHOM/CI/86/DAL972) TaxID=679716 RepID=D0A5Z3_TRYB9|nr:hypothetical protein, conserved [Trypanosoma brucei gambiense DAL972]CBH17094.1 hypothetical protein, conserved [Trypanosoma brucei gambiense DAL972]|eukprot:XP_011779358.1 hypothetical protein, conserved [Trypanosoma brucei gambiense DAL972]